MKKIYSIAKIGLLLSGLQLSYGAIAVSAETKTETKAELKTAVDAKPIVLAENVTPSASSINKVPILKFLS
jgi:hypothetical protein